MSKQFFLKNGLYFSAARIILFVCLFMFTKPSGQAFLYPAGADISEGTDVYYVAPDGDDDNPGTEAQPWATIQKACETLAPGSTAYVKEGRYNEKIYIEVSGSAGGGHITIRNYEDDEVIIDGTGISDSDIIYMENKNYVKIIGFKICNNTNVNDGSGIRIEGYGTHIEIRNNEIYEIRGSDAMGITVYGTNASKSISNLIIDGNEIYNCDPAHSEALTLNGNVEHFEVTNNIVHDVNNIGIDFIGGEGTCSDSDKDAARNGVCSGNVVYNARSSYGGGYAAGIYIDGGNNITVERNIVYWCDRGIELGCEIKDKVSYGNVARNNLVYNNDKSGIGIGGYDYPRTGKVTDSKVLNNTCFNNDTLNTGAGELLIEYADSCEIKNNIFYCSTQGALMTVSENNSANTLTLDYNVWYSASGSNDITVDWMGTYYEGFSEYVDGAGQDTNSLFDDPEFVNAALPTPDLHLKSGSPAIDAGDPGSSSDAGDMDIDNNTRVSGSGIDIGAAEYQENGGAVTSTTTTVPSGTTTTTTTIGEEDDEFCLAEEIYGEYSEEAELLRNFRDNALNRTPAGRKVIMFYYECSPGIVKMINENEGLKGKLKAIVDGLLPVIKERLE